MPETIPPGPRWRKLTGDDTDTLDYFGMAVAISGNYAIVGARGNDQGGNGAGAAYVFHWDGSSWTQMAKPLPNDIAEWYEFGFSVATSGNTAVVGTVRRLTNSNSDDPSFGCADIFSCENSIWSQKAQFQATNPSDQDYFGMTVGFSDGLVAVGCEGHC